MKSAKSYKISVLIIAFVLSVIAAFCSMNVGTVKANSASDPEDYFTVVESDSLAFEENNLVATLSEGNSLKFNNELVIDAFAIDLLVPQAVQKFSVVFETDSYFINGNPVTVDEVVTTYKTEVKTVFTVEFTGDDCVYYFNNADVDGTDHYVSVALSSEEGDRAIIVKFSVGVDRTILASVNNFDQISDFSENQVECVDKTTANVSIILDELAENEDSADLKIVSVDQNYTDTDGNYKQTFALDEETQKLTPVYPRVTLNDSAFIKNTDGKKAFNKLVMLNNVTESFTLNVYSVLGNYNSSSVYLSINDKDGPDWGETKKIVFYNKEDEKKEFNVVLKTGEDTVTIERYTVDVISAGDGVSALEKDTTAPAYVAATDNDGKAAIGGYKAALQKAVNKEVGEGADKQTVSISLGTKVELPSMRDLVYDDCTPYDDLTLSLNYYTRTSSKQTSSELGFKVTVAGDYLYYVVFTDNAGNAMSADDFMTTDEDNSDIINYGTYKDFIFPFKIEDNAPIDIETTSATGVGYIDIVYKASKFKIEAEGCNTTYTLYYNKNELAGKDDEGWIVIPAASKVTSKSYTDDYGNSYDSVQAINYDGELTFTPTAKGAYMIECVATSEYTVRTDSAYSIVSISNKPVYVEAPNYWLRDNVWSVVFLSIGTLCLIGIIVLLCIKPKDETESD